MGTNPQRKSGKQNRKFGRASRKPSHNHYNIEHRREKNKARKQAKIKKMLAKKALRKIKHERNDQSA